MATQAAQAQPQVTPPAGALLQLLLQGAGGSDYSNEQFGQKDKGFTWPDAGIDRTPEVNRRVSNRSNLTRKPAPGTTEGTKAAAPQRKPQTRQASEFKDGPSRGRSATTVNDNTRRSRVADVLANLFSG
jgi:hypothetical protein